MDSELAGKDLRLPELQVMRRLIWQETNHNKQKLQIRF